MLNLPPLSRTAPKAEDVNDLRARIAKLRARFPKDAQASKDYQGVRLEMIEKGLQDLDNTLKPLEADGKIDSAKWDAQSETERRDLAHRIRQLFDELRWLMRNERRLGRTYFGIFAGLLVVLIIAYVFAHWRHWQTVTRPVTSPAMAQRAEPTLPAAGATAKSAESATTIPPEKIVAVVRELKRVELGAAAQRAAKPAKPPGSAEEQKAFKDAAAATKTAVEGLRTVIDNLDLTFNTLQLFGNIDAEATNETLTDQTDSLMKLRPALLADLDSLRASFFWNDRVRRWIELAWWAELGVLVGILFYVAGTMSEGRFETENITMYWTEIAIAPVVVAVIFFLFTLTGITGISPSETSLQGNVGFAFIFGFAIRRTLGLLDSIKKRILPEPSP